MTACDKLRLLTKLLNYANDLNSNLIAAESSAKSLLVLRDTPLILAALKDAATSLIRVQSVAAAAAAETYSAIRSFEEEEQQGGCV